MAADPPPSTAAAAERRYVCENCDGSGTRRIATDADLDKACRTCDGRGYLDESEMERLMSGSTSGLLDWRLLVRAYPD